MAIGAGTNGRNRRGTPESALEGFPKTTLRARMRQIDAFRIPPANPEWRSHGAVGDTMISDLLSTLHRLWTGPVDCSTSVLAECLSAGRAALSMSTGFVAEIIDDEVCVRVVDSDDSAVGLGECLSLAQSPCAELVRTGNSVVTDQWESADTDETASASLTGARSWLGRAAGRSSVWVPIRVRGRLYGALVFADRDRTCLLSDVDRAFVELLACRAGSALESEWLSEAALHDQLTGLPNGRLLVDRLRQALARRGRQSGVLAVLFVDLDQFKRVNDSWRHEGGDTVLRETARRIARAVRPGDTVARPHGDEFVVVCEDIPDAARAEALARRIVDGVAEPINIGNDSVTITCSIGIALIGDDPTTAEGVLDRADAAMFRAKAAGRNGIELSIGV